MKKFNFLRIYAGLPHEIYILFIAYIVNNMGSFILPLSALILTQKIGFSKAEAGLFISLFAVTQAPCLIGGGRLIDFIGRRRVILLCESLGALIYVVCSFLPDTVFLAAALVLASDLYVIAFPAIQAIAADLTTPRNRKNAFSLLYFGVNIGYTVSPIIGGLLFENHLPVLFLLDAATTLLSMALILVFIRETRVAPAKTAEAGIGERTSVLKVLLKIRVLFFFLIIMFIYQFSYSQWNFTLPLQMGDLFGKNGARFYSMVVSLNAFLVIAFTPLLTHLTNRLRPLFVSAAGGLLYFAAFFLFAFSGDMPSFLFAGTVMTIGEIIISINTGTFIADYTPKTHRGRVNSLNTLVMGAGNAISPVIIGAVISRTSYTAVWLAVAAFMMTGAVSMFLLDQKAKKLPPSATE